MLNIEGTVHIVGLLAATHQLVHLGQRLVGKSHHLMDVVILLVGEVILLAVILTADGAGHVVTGIADRLQLTDFTQHGTNLSFRIVREVCIADRVKVFGNLQFHVVRNPLILLNTREKLVELCFIGTLLASGTTAEVQELDHHTEHALHTV